MDEWHFPCVSTCIPGVDGHSLAHFKKNNEFDALPLGEHGLSALVHSTEWVISRRELFVVT